MNAVRAGFVIDTLRPGAGTENQLLLLIRAFDRRRVVPFVCCLRDNPELAGLAREGVDAVVAGLRSFRSHRTPAGLSRVRRWIREKDVDVVVTFFRDANIAGTVAGRWARRPVLSSRRNMGHWHTPLELAILRAMNRMAHGFVANSEAVKAHTVAAEGVAAERIRVIENALELSRFEPREDPAPPGRPAAGPVVGCVANLRPVKSVATLVEAFPAVRARRPEARLVLVGEGEEEGRLREAAARLGVDGAVQFLGRRDDVPELLRGFDVGVLPSLAEGSPNAVLEYLAAGLPVVATAVGGTRELIEGRPFARLVAPRDAAAMADAIVALAEEVPAGSAAALEARRFVEERFAVPVIVEKWQRLLEEVRGPGSEGT